MSLFTSILYLCWVTDIECCNKLFPRKVINDIALKSKDFDFEPEITVKLSKGGYKIAEVPISTNPRGYKEGKKLNTFRDGTHAFLSLVKNRFVD